MEVIQSLCRLLATTTNYCQKGEAVRRPSTLELPDSSPRMLFEPAWKGVRTPEGEPSHFRFAYLAAAGGA